MSTVLHAFTTYSIKGDYGFYEIVYENDEDYDIASGNWHYIYTILQYGDFLLGIETNIPVYDYLDDADRVKKNGLELTDPQIFVKLCETVLKNITKLSDDENPIINGEDWYLYDLDLDYYGPITEQKNKLIDYAEKLLEWAKKGLYFVEEKA
jgi:hypothetical protein